MNISKRVVAAAAAAALAGLLAACSSAGGSTGPVAGGRKIASSPTSSTSATATAAAQVAVPKVTAGNVGTGAANPAPAGRSLAGFGSSASQPGSPSQGSSSVPALSGPVTYQSVSLPSGYNCTESGTTYYTPPNIAVGFDVTLLVNSSALAHDLVIAAPNRAPRGLSNASKLISSAALGNGVWRATYRAFASLYEPRYTPVTMSILQATAGGAHYTIAFPSPVSITKDDCHS